MLDCEFDGDDIFEEIASIRDPERPWCSLADLNVVHRERCSVQYEFSAAAGVPLNAGVTGSTAAIPRKKRTALVTVWLLPTVPHCHLMNIICLSVVARLREALPVTTHWKVRVRLVPGSHQQVEEIEKQVGDKERVAAALENPVLAAEIRKLTLTAEE